MNFIKTNKIFVVFLFLYLSFIHFGESFLSSLNLENLNIIKKRGLTLGATVHLANQLEKLNEYNKKERVTKHYRKPSDPYSYGRK
ncbi:Hypothetical protein SRAE_0000028700 [Strongyloides ratti]|uniref:Uncharacterized protein n=1 Tax=Strongyloides ratti TaxID=34506 RepID=A0A090L108_STRRB|nr:Hypothetical protein SRAE_0000028700 [Strongyloides ratti]CEF61159.1 Hypothetical protein SRAE_0000028700 [Strongyloides ratti]